MYLSDTFYFNDLRCLFAFYRIQLWRDEKKVNVYDIFKKW